MKKTTKNKVVAIIVAGGSGKRMGSKIPKQFLLLDKKPILARTIEKFEKNPGIHGIVLVSHPGHIARVNGIIKKYKFKKILSLVSGGVVRQESCYNGIVACPEGTGYVLIHDAARPFVTGRVIDDVIKALSGNDAVIPVIESKDTLVQVNNGFVSDILNRDAIKGVQTPQGFRYAVIKKAYMWALSDGVEKFTDDGGIALGAGVRVVTVQGDEANRKITTKQDLN